MEYKTQSGEAIIPFNSVIAFEGCKGINNHDAILIYLVGGNTIIIYMKYDEYKKKYDQWGCRR